MTAGRRRERTAEFLSLIASHRGENAPPPQRRRQKPSAVQKRASALLGRLDKAEKHLRAVGEDYSSPALVATAGKMTDRDRDALEERVGNFLLECRRAFQEISTNNPHDTALIQVVLERAKMVSTLFERLHRLRCRRDLTVRRSLTSPCENGALTLERIDPTVEGAAGTLSEAEEAGLREMGRRALAYAPPEPLAPPPPIIAAVTRVKEPITPTVVAPRQEEEEGRRRQQQQQQQVLMRDENTALAAEFEGELDAARRLESRMENVSQLMTTFSTLVEDQSQTIGGLFETVEEASELIDRGGDELNRAAQRKSSFPKFFNTLVIAAAFALLCLHWLKT